MLTCGTRMSCARCRKIAPCPKRTGTPHMRGILFSKTEPDRAWSVQRLGYKASMGLGVQVRH